MEVLVHHIFLCTFHSIEKEECIPVGCVQSAAVAISPGMHAPRHACPPVMHAPSPPCMIPLPHMPPCHACLPPHTLSPHTHPHTLPCHACHPLPRMPHPCHACPPLCTPALPHTIPHHVCPPAIHAPHHACPPRTEFLTHASENVAFPQLRLRTVIKIFTWCISLV